METTEIQSALAGLDLVHNLDAKDFISDALIILQVVDHQTGRAYPVVTHTMESSLVMIDGLAAQYPRYRESLEYLAIGDDED